MLAIRSKVYAELVIEEERKLEVLDAAKRFPSTMGFRWLSHMIACYFISGPVIRRPKQTIECVRFKVKHEGLQMLFSGIPVGFRLNVKAESQVLPVPPQHGTLNTRGSYPQRPEKFRRQLHSVIRIQTKTSYVPWYSLDCLSGLGMWNPNPRVKDSICR